MSVTGCLTALQLTVESNQWFRDEFANAARGINIKQQTIF
jgi:hypothetical protein